MAALLLWTAATFVALALGSYAGSPATPGAAVALPTSTGPNWVGPVGETCARGLVPLLGLVFLGLAVRIWRSGKVGERLAEGQG